MAAVEKRLREELAELQVEINEEKSRTVDLRRGESFGFLGFDFRRVRSLRGVWRAHYTPKLKKRTALLRKLKDVFRRHQNLHAAFDEAGAGNVAWPRWCDTRNRKSETTGNTNFGLNWRASPRPYR